MGQPGLRERKKRRTRRALFEAALRLFSEHGYEQTTIADIAAAADVSPRTFFSYYPSKEQVVFYDAPDRQAQALDTIASRRPGESPIELLVRAVRQSQEMFRDEWPVEVAVQRMRLIKAVPVLRAHQLRLLDDARHRLSDALLAAFGDEVSEVDARIAAAIVMSAILSATMLALESERPELVLDSMTERSIELVVHGLGAVGAAAGLAS